MIADLHIHTTFSDGSSTPSEVILEARRRGLGCIAICDHDTTATTMLATDYGLRAGIATIPAVEISAFDFPTNRKIHLLGYGYSAPAREIERLCAPLRDTRDRLTRDQIGILAAAGYPVSEDDVRRVAISRMTEVEQELWPGVLYERHIMGVLIQNGLTTELHGDLYRELFTGDGICAHEIAYVDVLDALAAIKADGGRAVLAHPGQQDSFDLVGSLAAAGLDGIELYHRDHTRVHHRRVLELAHDYDLILTGGSDAHGEHGSIHAIGDICAPDGAVEALISIGDSDVDWAVDLVRGAREIVLAALLEDRDSARKDGDNRDLVTTYDTAVERLLVEAITTHYPEDAILAEERDEPPPESSGALWIIDPIDGTTNFVTAHRDFAISVARYRDGLPIFGIVYDCTEDVLYLGVTGRGAWRNGVRLPFRSASAGAAHHRIAREDAIIEISVSTVDRLQNRNTIVDTGEGQPPDHPVFDPAALTIAHRAQRAYGYASLGLCRVAEGSLDIYLSARISVWDYAAAQVVLAEVGGETAVELTEGEGAHPWAGALSAADTGPASLILHRERRFVVSAADRSLLDRTLEDYFHGHRSFWVAPGLSSN